jgi:hypothetical protein
LLRRASILTAVISGALLFASAREARAYPQFQFSSGTTRCGQCHYSPSGGTLISSWGRDEAGDTISLGGDGSFLHGLWAPPEWLSLGLDVRLAALRNDVGGADSPEVAFFPMQADLYTRLAYDAFSLNVTVGARGVVRPPDPSLGGRTSDVGQRLMSREHYLMWRPSATGPYVRVGRFQAPYGLRFVEHIFFVRANTGYNLYEETYNASGGYVAEDWEVHATAFTHIPTSLPDFLGASGAAENGGVGYYERRFANMAALGVQTRIGIGKEESRYQGGAVGKLWVEKARLLFLGEADFIHQTFPQAGNFAQNQFVSYTGVTYVIRGYMLGVAYERFQEDLSVKNTGRNAVDGEVSLFPWAHFELNLLGRYETRATAAPNDTTNGSLVMLQLHYYL